jgi:hypothetical protein
MRGCIGLDLIRPKDDRSIVWFLHLNGLNAIRIHHEREAMFGPDAVPYSTVIRTLHILKVLFKVKTIKWRETGHEIRRNLTIFRHQRCIITIDPRILPCDKETSMEISE